MHLDGNKALLPDSFGVSFPLALLSLICWGSWTNTRKAVPEEDVKFPHYYMDYSLGLAFASTVAFLTMGGAHILHDDEHKTDLYFSVGDHDVPWKQIWSSLAAGTIFNIANVLLILGIDLAGLVVAFPVAIGVSLVLGTTLTYIVDPKGSAPLLFSGMALAVAAVLSMAHAHKVKSASEDTSDGVLKEQSDGYEQLESQEDPSADQHAPSFKTSMMICLVGGIFMGCWSPIAAFVMDKDHDGALTAYCYNWLFSLAVLFTSLPICYYLSHKPVKGGEGYPVQMREYFGYGLPQHSWGFLGGFIWEVGTLANAVAGDDLGFALCYALGQSAPMMAVLYGVFYFKEFTGVSTAVWGWLGATLFFYFGAIGLIAASH